MRVPIAVLMTAGLAGSCVTPVGEAVAPRDNTSGTFAPVGPPATPPVRTSAGAGCVVELTQPYTVAGVLRGNFGIDYRILVDGECGAPPGTFAEEWIAVGTFDGTLRSRRATGVFTYTARVAAGGDVEGRIVFGQGIEGELSVTGAFSDGGLSYTGWAVSAEREPTPQTDARLLHQRYMTASILHDMATLRRLTHENAEWRPGPYTVRGRDEVLGPNEYDAGLQNRIEYRNVVIRGDTVETELVERNDLVRAVGMSEVRGFPRYVFEGGLLVRREPWRTSEDVAEFQARLEPLRRWIQAHHPEALEVFMGESGGFRLSQASGALMVRLAREWVKAGAPGRLPSR